MASLNVRTFAGAVAAFAAAVQSRASALIDFSTGALLLAVAEATAGIVLWLQSLVYQTLLISRGLTSTGTDLDTWALQFMPALPGTVSAALPNGTPRTQATFATGQVTVGRYTVSASMPFVPVGSLFKSADGSLQFQVVSDTTNNNYSSALAGYTLPANVATMNVAVQCLSSGSIGNVAAGAITMVASQLTGTDYAINNSAFVNGVNQESDADLYARVQLFFPSLSKGTRAAIVFWVDSVQSGMQTAIFENVDANGATNYGAVTIVIDDGSGAMPMSTLQAAMAALENTRPAGIRYEELAATTLTANWSMTISAAPGYLKANLIGQVAAAVNAYINALGENATLYYSQIATQAYAVPGVVGVEGALLNGGTVDLVPAMLQTIKAGSGAVS